jgi:hypothetical protein
VEDKDVGQAKFWYNYHKQERENMDTALAVLALAVSAGVACWVLMGVWFERKAKKKAAELILDAQKDAQCLLSKMAVDSNCELGIWSMGKGQFKLTCRWPDLAGEVKAVIQCDPMEISIGQALAMAETSRRTIEEQERAKGNRSQGMKGDA